MEQEQLNELMKARRQKLHQLKEKGIDPFGKKYVASHYSADIIAHFDELENKGFPLPEG